MQIIVENNWQNFTIKALILRMKFLKDMNFYIITNGTKIIKITLIYKRGKSRILRIKRRRI